MHALSTGNNLLTSVNQPTGSPSWRDWALQYLPGARVTAEIQRGIPEAIRQAEASLAPATPQQLAVQVARLDDFATAFNVPNEHLRTAAAIYRDTLGHLPPDLLELAVSRVIAAHKWGMRLPLPAEIAGQVSEEIAERRKVLGRLQIAKRAATELPPRERSAEEVAAVDALIESWRRARDA